MGLESLLMFGLSAAGGVMATSAAGKQASRNAMLGREELRGQYEQTGIQNQQLMDEIKSIELAAGQAANERLEQAASTKTRNAAFVSASGTGFNASEAVAAREIDRNAARDVTTLGYNAALQGRRVVDQIRVNRMALRTGSARAAVGISNGVANTIGVGQQSLIKAGEALVKYSSADLKKAAQMMGG